MKYILIFSAFLSFSFLQTPTKTDLIGNWEFVKHTFNNGQPTPYNTDNTSMVYNFKENGKYELKSKYTYNKKVNSITTVGSWNISGLNINFFDSYFLPPNDNDGLVGDHPLKVIKLTTDTLIVEEYISELKGKTIYVKK